jgi:hypothetical protein
LDALVAATRALAARVLVVPVAFPVAYAAPAVVNANAKIRTLTDFISITPSIQIKDYCHAPRRAARKIRKLLSKSRVSNIVNMFRRDLAHAVVSPLSVKMYPDAAQA